MRKFTSQFPEFSNFFPFEEFNHVQSKCYSPIVNDQRNMVVSAPTSSGKTVIFQLAIINQMRLGLLKCLYLAPIKSLCHQKSQSWGNKFHHRLKMFELTSDTPLQQQNNNQLSDVNLVIATPEKIDSFSRKSLDYLSKLNLLLVDQVHMLNFEERGATLEAVVSRIMSINQPRIIAVSATIPNIKEVAEWLKVSKQHTFVFGQECRPVKINKVVLGFKSSNNPYTFQRLLNYKLTQIIRTYSQQKGTLVFCQTQKGTEMACQQVISDMKERQFIDNDQKLLSLIQASKRVANTSLQIMIPQGVAFHNAGLSMQDRTIVEKLFLQNKIRVLCTTSTLAMGINLPARLVVIKSTQCYKGSGKGYQEYTQIQMDQMMGRAGRPPFDKEGTVVIMTQKQNYNKYLNSGKLETLQSHLYRQLCQHINAQICLKSIKSVKDVLKYFMNSFCYIRMKNSPGVYCIKENIENHVERICMQSIMKLDTYNLIKYHQENGAIASKQLGVNVARNSIEIDTIVLISKQLSKIKTERDYLILLCESEEIKRYRNKLDERKLLKELNQKNKYVIKNAISNPEKKAYVLVQSELDGSHIQNWELRKQAREIIYFLRRLTFCVKTVSSNNKLFWPYLWSTIMNKFFTIRFWERNDQMVIRQFDQLNEKWKMLSMKGFKNLDHIINNLHHLDTICQKNSSFSHQIYRKITNLKQCVSISIQKHTNHSVQEEEEAQQQLADRKKFRDVVILINFTGNFDHQFKCITIIVGQGPELYTIRSLRQGLRQTKIAINSNKTFNIGVVRNNFIGFDEFYQVTQGKNIRRIDNIDLFMDGESNDKVNRKQKGEKYKGMKDKHDDISQGEGSQRRLTSKIERRKSTCSMQSNQNKRQKSNKMQINSEETGQNEKERSLGKLNRITDPLIKKKKKEKNQISRKKCAEEIKLAEEDTIYPSMRPGTYIPLNQYKCWKPGIQKRSSGNMKAEIQRSKPALLVQQSSKSKPSIEKKASKDKNFNVDWQRYAFKVDRRSSEQIRKTYQRAKKEERNIDTEQTMKRPAIRGNPYQYFFNLFQN